MLLFTPSVLFFEAAMLPRQNGSSKRRPSVWGVYNIYIIYTPNLRLTIAVFDREKRQGCFKEHRGSTEGVGGSTKGARGSRGKQKGAEGTRM